MKSRCTGVIINRSRIMKRLIKFILSAFMAKAPEIPKRMSRITLKKKFKIIVQAAPKNVQNLVKQYYGRLPVTPEATLSSFFAEHPIIRREFDQFSSRIPIKQHCRRLFHRDGMVMFEASWTELRSGEVVISSAS